MQTRAYRWERLLLLLGICLGVLAGMFYGLDAGSDDFFLIRKAERTIREDFKTETTRYRQLLIQDPEIFFPKAESDLNEFGLLQNRVSDSKLIIVAYDKQGGLVRWSSQHFVPSDFNARYALQAPKAAVLLREKNLYYYAMRHRCDTLTYLLLLPLKVSYPIKNEYLVDYVYFGRNTRLGEEVAKTAVFSLEPSRQGINFTDEWGSYLCSLHIWDTTPLRRNSRLFVLGFGLFAGIVVLGWFALFLRRVIETKLIRVLLFFGILGVLRILLLYFHLPGSYVDIELFSSHILAINDLNPSLGDFTLNIFLLMFFIIRILRLAPQQPLADLLLRLPRWLLAVVFTVAGFFSFWLFRAYFSLFDVLVVNSRVYYEFADLFQLNYYSYLVFFNIALLLIFYFILQYFIAGVMVRVQRNIEGAIYVMPALLGIVIVIAWIADPLVESTLPAVFLLSSLTIYSIRFGAQELTRLPLPQTLMVLGLFAVLTHYAIGTTFEQNIESRLRLIADRFHSNKDLLTEHIFDDVVDAIRADQQNWTLDASLDEALNRIVNNHLLPAIRGYDFHIFAFDEEGKRIDNQEETQPFFLTRTAATQGRTLSEDLFRVQYHPSVTREIYIGRFTVWTKPYGMLTLQVEMHPKFYVVGKLYPQLLLDAPLKQRLALPPGFEVGVYRFNQLIQKVESRPGDEGYEQLPRTLSQSLTRVNSYTAFNVGDKHYEYIDHNSEGRTVLVRAPRRSLIDKLSSITLLFYFYLLLYILLRVPDIIRAGSNGSWLQWRYSLVYKIQFFVVLLSLVPMLALWLLSSALFRNFYYRHAVQELRSNLQQVATALSADPEYMADIDHDDFEANTQSRKKLAQISNLLACDINVYQLNGRLHNTTKMRIYHTALSSVYINPQAYTLLTKGQNPERIQVEKIGNMTYLSGYVPLLDNQNTIRGILNIPYLSQQDLMQYQTDKFVSYVVNLYVVLLLVMVIGGLFVSRSITLPLKLLKAKMDQTSLGLTNEPVAWASKDEIGALIASYNRMLHKLSINEQKLAKNERELAWRGMARQVAHEIKNPLTPMKLNIQHLSRLLSSANLDPEDKARVEKISRTLLTQIDSLTAIANTFSQFATMPVEQFAPFSLNTLVQEVGALFAEEEGVELLLSLPEHELIINGDRSQLNRALVNLVRNAVQAIQNTGWVKVHLFQKNDRACITIEDNGVGIPYDVQPRIFEPSFSTKNSGMGLGLAITQRIVEAMKGEIRFESEPNKGTIFILEFPIYAV